MKFKEHLIIMALKINLNYKWIQVFLWIIFYLADKWMNLDVAEHFSYTLILFTFNVIFSPVNLGSLDCQHPVWKYLSKAPDIFLNLFQLTGSPERCLQQTSLWSNCSLLTAIFQRAPAHWPPNLQLVGVQWKFKLPFVDTCIWQLLIWVLF